jgi:N terminus of Rad21 / Rec8 like protein
MDPEVPQALRLQAMLTSGVCTVFDRQSQYLLEDFQDCLNTVNAASANLADEVTKDGPILARPADINMMEELSINIDAFAAPAAFPTPGGQNHSARRSRRLLEENEDLVMVPSIPESVDDRAKSGQSPRNMMMQAQDQDYFMMYVTSVIFFYFCPGNNFFRNLFLVF